MDIRKSLSRFEKETSNLETKKKLSLLNSHIGLLDKYLESDGRIYSGTTKSYSNSERVLSQLTISKSLFIELLASYKKTVDTEFGLLLNNHRWSPLSYEVDRFLSHMGDLLEIELAGEEEIEEGNVFLGIEEKFKRANKSAREGNKEGMFSSLHTIFELFLKDKLGIALDMDGAKLGLVLGICIKNDVFKGKSNILKRLDENVAKIDNKIKHSAYDPSGKETNDALLVSTQAYRILKREEADLNDAVLEQISSILIKNN